MPGSPTERSRAPGHLTVLLPAPRGFCAGVEMAIEGMERALERFGTPLFAYHQIVHNKHVVASFEARGVTFVDDVADVPAGGTVVFSAHGVAPAVRVEARARGLMVIDATCPLVTKVHSEARRFARSGYTVMLVGHRGHDESVGILGETGVKGRLVETLDDVERVEPADPERVVVLTQTTLSVTDATRIVDRLRERFPSIRMPATQDICYATENRQMAVDSIAAEADLVLVVGSRNSSNSKRLVEQARRAGTPAYLIDGPEDIDDHWFEGISTLAITAGASVPESFVQNVIAWTRERYRVTVEERLATTEDVSFRLPVPVR